MISGLEDLARGKRSGLRDEWATERGLQLVAESTSRAPRDFSAFARAIDDWLARIGV